MTVKLAFDRIDGPPERAPLVLMHGLLGSARNWRSFAKAWGRERTVLAVDLRNHGRSSWSDTMDYPSMAADILALIADQALERPVLLGHSMGGKVAMTTGLSQPETIGGLIVVDIAPVTYDHSFEDYLQAMQALGPSAMVSRSAADKALAPAIEDPAVRAFILQNLEPGDDPPRWRPNLPVLSREMNALVGWPNTYDGRQSDLRVDSIAGAQSPYVTAEGQAAMKALFPQVEHHTIAEAGHWVHADRPYPFNDAVQAALSKLDKQH